MRRTARPTATVALICLTLSAGPAAPQALRVADRVPFTAATAHPLPAGPASAPVWSIRVEHPGATFIGVHFDRFELAPGERAVVRSPSGGRPHVYTGRGRQDMGAFWASHVKGDVAVVEVFAASSGGGGWGVSIDQYAAGFVDVDKEAAELTTAPEAICGTNDKKNAICYNDGAGGDDDVSIYNRSRAVARLLVESTLLCTGWLVGCEGHLLTNNHCVDSPELSGDPAAAAANTDYEFMAEAPACGPVCSGCTGVVWPGAATLVQRDVDLDYAFIQLADNPQVTYGSFLLDNRTPVVNERIYIPQHAGGRAKEIAVTSTDGNDPSGFCEIFSTNETPCIGGTGDIGYHCDTEGGSSGSPVVAYSNHQVISLHHCADCPNRGLPIAAVIGDLGAALPACAFDPLPALLYASHVVDDAGGNGDGVADPGEVLTLPVDLLNAGSGTATLVEATLTTAEPMVTILDGTASWPDVPGAQARTSIAPHFSVLLDPSLPCGMLVAFDLSISAAEGAFESSFQTQVGTNTATTLVRNSTDTPRAIPDNNAAGTTSTLAVADVMTLGDLNVAVNITHTWKSDLIVELTSPSNTTVRLHNRSGADADDIITTYDLLTLPDGPGGMADFDGEPFNGSWRLKVSDLDRFVTGTLQSWSLIAEGPPNFVCNAASAAAGRTSDLLVAPAAGGDLFLSWGPSCQAADGDYEVYEGVLGSFASHAPRTCSTAGATSWTLTPAVASAYYLVVPTNGVREGSYGVDSAGVERGPGAAACMAQQASCP